MSLKRGASEWAVGNWLVAAALEKKLVDMVWRAVRNWQHGFLRGSLVREYQCQQDKMETFAGCSCPAARFIKQL